jgi:L-alanine-DL-glutamate epimerase-like enolase superfamily enzyme
MARIAATHERWPLSRPFRISRGVKDAADVVVAEIVENGLTGRGEAVPYARYGETIESVLAQIEAARGAVAQSLSRADLQNALAPGAARNALDCALWELEARGSGRTLWDLVGVAAPADIVTAVTVSLDTPEKMAAAAAEMKDAPLLKVKVDAAGAARSVAAVRAAAPGARLIVDPNESWTIDDLRTLAPVMAELRVHLIEQPLPADADDALESVRFPVPLCADESLHVRADLDRVTRRYQVVNIKLDKTGGLTEALLLEKAARARGLGVMIGCMVCTSLGIAPALPLAAGADFVDLDGPWWLKEDRPEAVKFHNGRLIPPSLSRR